MVNTGRFWAFVPVALLGTMFVGLGSMAYVAIHDPGFALEKDYYKKAIAWDAHQAQEAENTRLGWQLELASVRWPSNAAAAELTVTLRGANGAPISGATLDVEAFANAHASVIRNVPLRERQPGQFTGVLLEPSTGLWELRFRGMADNLRFTHTIRTELARERLK